MDDPLTQFVRRVLNISGYNWTCTPQKRKSVTNPNMGRWDAKIEASKYIDINH